MTLTEAAKTLGMHYVSIHRLRREGKLAFAPDGVDRDSVLAYQRRRRQPRGFMEASLAADRLGIPRRAMSDMAEHGLLTARPRPGRGWWVKEEDIEFLEKHPDRLALLGLKVEPPEGWLTPAQARRLLRCGPSWLSSLARKGLIRRRMFGENSAWYLLKDIQDYLRDQQPA